MEENRSSALDAFMASLDKVDNEYKAKSEILKKKMLTRYEMGLAKDTIKAAKMLHLLSMLVLDKETPTTTGAYFLYDLALYIKEVSPHLLTEIHELVVLTQKFSDGYVELTTDEERKQYLEKCIPILKQHKDYEQVLGSTYLKFSKEKMGILGDDFEVDLAHCIYSS